MASAVSSTFLCAWPGARQPCLPACLLAESSSPRIHHLTAPVSPFVHIVHDESLLHWADPLTPCHQPQRRWWSRGAVVVIVILLSGDDDDAHARQPRSIEQERQRKQQHRPPRTAGATSARVAPQARPRCTAHTGILPLAHSSRGSER